MTTPTVAETRRNGNPVGERIELARYTVPAGQRILYGQRVNGRKRPSHGRLGRRPRPCPAPPLCGSLQQRRADGVGEGPVGAPAAETPSPRTPGRPILITTRPSQPRQSAITTMTSPSDPDV